MLGTKQAKKQGMLYFIHMRTLSKRIARVSYFRVQIPPNVVQLEAKSVTRKSITAL